MKFRPLLKVAIVLIPSYTVAWLSGEMVYSPR